MPKPPSPQQGIRPHTPPDGQAKPKKAKRPRRRGPIAKSVIAAVQIGFILYAALLVTLVLLETRLVFPGAYLPESMTAPLNASAGIETVEYQSTDNLTLRGRLMERSGSDRFVLIFHGNAQKAMWLDGWLTQVAEAFDATTMIAEYRGFADDTTPTEKGVLSDCFAARNYLCNRFEKGPTDIILLGRSLGGGCAVAVAAQGGAAGVVLDRTFDCAVDIAAGTYPFVPVRLLMKNRFDSLSRITVYDGPLVSVHGTNDEVIPVQNGRRLFEKASGPKKWIEIKDFGHLKPMSEGVLQQLADELSRLQETQSVPTSP